MIWIQIAAMYVLSTQALYAEEFTHQHIEPAALVNSWNSPDEDYVEASIVRMLKPAQRVAVPYKSSILANRDAGMYSA